MLARFLASAMVTGLLLNAGVMTGSATAQSTALASDSSFIQLAGSYGLLQVKLGKLAQDKSSSAAVRDFAKRMLDDYTKANAELAAGAKQAAYPSPVVLRQHKQTLDRFSSMSKSSFDRNYMAEMVTDLGDASRLFQQEAEAGRVASLKQLASRMLPEVQQHLAMATETARAVGADVTATAATERRGS